MFVEREMEMKDLGMRSIGPSIELDSVVHSTNWNRISYYRPMEWNRLQDAGPQTYGVMQIITVIFAFPLPFNK